MVELIDSHCHLTELSESELSSVLVRAKESCVVQAICIGASDKTSSSRKAVELANSHDSIFATVGIHPHDAGEFLDLTPLEDLLQNSKVVAIGETGLDYYRDWSPFEAQRELFQNSIRTAKRQGKPLVIHCRDAADDTLRILRAEDASSCGGVFHCYAGDAKLAAELREMNFYVSFTGNLTFKKAQALQEAASQIPLEQMLLETDSPYMAPEPFRGKPSEPMHVATTAAFLAKLKGAPIEQVAEITTANSRRLFKLPVVS